MKTEQEQIKAIKQIIDERVETTLGQVQGRHDNVIKTVDTVIIARDIVNAGYGDLSEYKAEIERLRQEVRDTDKMARNSIEQYKNNYDKAFEQIKAQEREIDKLREDNIYLKEELYELHDDLDIARAKKDKTINQAKIDVLNRVMTYINDKIENDYGDMSDSVNYLTIDIDDFDDFIDELIREVENEQKD